jgi:hypothetical protein
MILEVLADGAVGFAELVLLEKGLRVGKEFFLLGCRLR